MLRIIALCLALAAAPSSAGAQSVHLNVVQESLELKPADILSAEAVLEDGQWVIAIRLAPGAAAMFGALTERNLGKATQVVVDDRIITAPIIRSVIKGGELRISGRLDETSAKELARKIKP
jgi:preprotein translocase subunit SecD